MAECEIHDVYDEIDFLPLRVIESMAQDETKQSQKKTKQTAGFHGRGNSDELKETGLMKPRWSARLTAFFLSLVKKNNAGSASAERATEAANSYFRSQLQPHETCENAYGEVEAFQTLTSLNGPQGIAGMLSEDAYENVAEDVEFSQPSQLPGRNDSARASKHHEAQSPSAFSVDAGDARDADRRLSPPRRQPERLDSHGKQKVNEVKETEQRPTESLLLDDVYENVEEDQASPPVPRLPPKSAVSKYSTAETSTKSKMLSLSKPKLKVHVSKRTSQSSSVVSETKVNQNDDSDTLNKDSAKDQQEVILPYRTQLIPKSSDKVIMGATKPSFDVHEQKYGGAVSNFDVDIPADDTYDNIESPQRRSCAVSDDCYDFFDPKPFSKPQTSKKQMYMKVIKDLAIISTRPSTSLAEDFGDNVIKTSQELHEPLFDPFCAKTPTSPTKTASKVSDDAQKAVMQRQERSKKDTLPQRCAKAIQLLTSRGLPQTGKSPKTTRKRTIISSWQWPKQQPGSSREEDRAKPRPKPAHDSLQGPNNRNQPLPPKPSERRISEIPLSMPLTQRNDRNSAKDTAATTDEAPAPATRKLPTAPPQSPTRREQKPPQLPPKRKKNEPECQVHSKKLCRVQSNTPVDVPKASLGRDEKTTVVFLRTDRLKKWERIKRSNSLPEFFTDSDEEAEVIINVIPKPAQAIENTKEDDPNPIEGNSDNNGPLIPIPPRPKFVPVFSKQCPSPKPQTSPNVHEKAESSGSNEEKAPDALEVTDAFECENEFYMTLEDFH